MSSNLTPVSSLSIETSTETEMIPVDNDVSVLVTRCIEKSCVDIAKRKKVVRIRDMDTKEVLRHLDLITERVAFRKRAV